MTLIELLVAMTLTAIIATLVGQLIARPLQAYEQLLRRAQLAEIAQAAFGNISRELRGARPDSLRVGCAGTCVEFLPARSPQPDVPTASGPVTYLCDPASGSLRRYWAYPIRAGGDSRAELSALRGARSAPLADRVESCDFSYRPGDGSRAGLLRLSLGLASDFASGHRERIVLLLQTRVAKAP